MDNIDQQIIKERVTAFDKIEGIRVGDYIKEKDGNITRVTYIWDLENEPNQIQTGGNGGSYGLGIGHMEYSGGLNTGYLENEIKATDKRKEGKIWFFHHNYHTGHNGVEASMYFRIFEVVEISKEDTIIQDSKNKVDMLIDLALETNYNYRISCCNTIAQENQP